MVIVNRQRQPPATVQRRATVPKQSSPRLAHGLYTLIVYVWSPFRLPDDIPYDRWVRYVFDTPNAQTLQDLGRTDHRSLPGWNVERNYPRALSFMTQLFETPEFLIGRYTRGEIDAGLSFIASTDQSSHMLAILDTDLPWTDRKRLLDAMVPLYTKLMAPVYGDDLSSARRGPVTGVTRPSFACYMWWEIVPLWAGMKHIDQDRINDTVLDIFEQVLRLKAESCLESALHGLSHWSIYMPDRTEPIVRRFLQRTDISPALREYAECAAVGSVE